jgi:putative transposase
MARRRRRLYEGAIYHAGARGNRRQAIFADDRDRRSYLSLLTETCRRYGWLCHGYCLMGNHYHLLIETPYANLDEGMRYLNGVYATRFNRRHALDGHLFQGRYWAAEIPTMRSCCVPCATSPETRSRPACVNERSSGRGRATG